MAWPIRQYNEFCYRMLALLAIYQVADQWYGVSDEERAYRDFVLDGGDPESIFAVEEVFDVGT